MPTHPAGRIRTRLRRFSDRFHGPGAWRAWSGLLLLLLLLAYLVYVVRTAPPAIELRALLARLSPGDLATAALLYGLVLAVAILGWSLIIGTLSACWSVFEHTRIYTVTAVTRRLPGTFWYMLGRVVLYERLGVPRGLTALASGLEFVAMVLGGTLVALLTWPLVLGGQTLNPLLVLLPLLIAALLLNPPLVRSLVRRFGRSAGAPAVRYRQVLLWIGVFALTWYIGGVLLFVVTRAVTPLPLSRLPAIVGVWAVAGVAATLFFSFLPFGLGATELTLAALLTPFVPTGEALFIALVMRVILTACELGYGLLGGLLYLPDLLARRGPFAAQIEQAAHQDAAESEEVLAPARGIPPK